MRGGAPAAGSPGHLPFTLGGRFRLAGSPGPAAVGPAPRPARAPPRGGPGGCGAGGAQTRRPAQRGEPRERNALRGGKSARGREDRRAAPGSGDERRQPAAQRRERARASLGPERATFPAKCQLRREHRARTFCAREGERRRAFETVGKKNRIAPRPLSPPRDESPLKSKNNKNYSKLAITLSALHSRHHEGGRRSQTDPHHHQDGKSGPGAFSLPG